MPHITRDSLMSLESYAKVRPDMRAEIMAHKKNRMVELGDHVTLIFEDEKTMRYQIQEMLRAERTFEESGIQDELDAYNPLVPDGTNWKATMMIQYSDPDERKLALAKLKGIEERVWVQVADQAKVLRLPTKIWSARTRRKPRRCISCVSSSIRPRSQRPGSAVRSAWASISPRMRLNR